MTRLGFRERYDYVMTRLGFRERYDYFAKSDLRKKNFAKDAKILQLSSNCHVMSQN